MAIASLIEAPQWQGSGSPHRNRLTVGAAELADLLPAKSRVRAEVVDTGTPSKDGVSNLDALTHNLAAMRSAIGRRRGSSGLEVVVGGDCAVDLAPVEKALAVHGDGLAVVWFDAHADLNTPTSSPSGAFHGMVLRALLGEGPGQLLPSRPLRPDQVVLAGVRALDAGEREFIAEHRLRHVVPADLSDPTTLVAHVAAAGADAVYVHIDLDVLDPTVFDAVGTPEPGGVSPVELVGAVRALAGRFDVAGLSLCEYEANGAEHREMLAQLTHSMVRALGSGV